MSTVAEFITKSNELLGLTFEGDFKDVKDTFEALHKNRPDLISNDTFQRLTQLLDSVKIAYDTQKQVNTLSFHVQKLQENMVKHTRKLGDETKKLTSAFQAMTRVFTDLERRARMDGEAQTQRNKKLVGVLNKLEQYLRIHT